uniref:Uncharacterized protein n=1 Tax=Echinococcus granulosus TaxID=6210 RepID=A0A068WM87_ECHGR|nr:hypothetical protein EgrG_000493900 [Echinococcus granulosus]
MIPVPPPTWHFIPSILLQLSAAIQRQVVSHRSFSISQSAIEGDEKEEEEEEEEEEVPSRISVAVDYRFHTRDIRADDLVDQPILFSPKLTE